MEWRSKIGKLLEVRQGDITRIEADAIVNAANARLSGGGGVDGAIHRAAGPAIMRELGPIRTRIGVCPAGKAVATSAGQLNAQFIFHAVGPVWRGGQSGEPAQLASCYRECLAMAEERHLESIAFPAISTGVYGYPMRDAAEIAIREIQSHLENPGTVARVTMVLFDEDALREFEGVLAGRRRSGAGG